jgi:hypothetical protein
MEDDEKDNWRDAGSNYQDAKFDQSSLSGSRRESQHITMMGGIQKYVL